MDRTFIFIYVTDRLHKTESEESYVTDVSFNGFIFKFLPVPTLMLCDVFGITVRYTVHSIPGYSTFFSDRHFL
jgi:hypothetical protein